MAEAEVVLITALEAGGPTARYCTELPATLTGATVRVTRISGTDGGQFSVFEDAVVDFDCFDPARSNEADATAARRRARTLAHDVRAYLRNTLPGEMVGTTAFVVSVRSVNGPAWVPYDNTDVRRFVYTAQIRIHSI